MDATIGQAAGQIWHWLQTHGPCSVSQLRKGTGLSERLMYMSIGWLAREGKLAFLQEREVLKLTLHATPDA